MNSGVAAPGSVRTQTRRSCARLRQQTHLASSDALLCPSPGALAVTLKWEVLSHSPGCWAAQPAECSIPVVSEDKGRGENRGDFHGCRRDRAQRGQGHRKERLQPEAVCPGLVWAPGVDVSLSPHCPARPAWGHLSGQLPRFHVKGRRDMVWGPGAAICSWEGVVLRATRPRTRAEGQGG